MYKVKQTSIKVLLTMHYSNNKLEERGHILSNDIKYSGNMGNFFAFSYGHKGKYFVSKTENMNIKIRTSFFKFQCDNLLF